MSLVSVSLIPITITAAQGVRLAGIIISSSSLEEQ
jgi:hypothetical protein